MFLASWIENDNAAFSENLYISYMESFKNNNFFSLISLWQHQPENTAEIN